MWGVDERCCKRVLPKSLARPLRARVCRPPSGARNSAGGRAYRLRYSVRMTAVFSFEKKTPRALQCGAGSVARVRRWRKRLNRHNLSAGWSYCRQHTRCLHSRHRTPRTHKSQLVCRSAQAGRSLRKKFSDEHHRPCASPACPRACQEHASLCVHVHISRVPAVQSAIRGTYECTAGSAWAQQGSMATNARKARSGGRICTGVHVHESETR